MYGDEAATEPRGAWWSRCVRVRVRIFRTRPQISPFPLHKDISQPSHGSRFVLDLGVWEKKQVFVQFSLFWKPCELNSNNVNNART